jgi:pimeloyl-ACP methyl ester carboxylesterase
VRESDGQLIFISLTQALFGDQALTLPVTGLELRGTTNLQPEGLLEEIDVIPLLYSIDVYASLMAQLRHSNKKNQKVVSLTYDWRGDLMEAVRNLDELIRQLRIEGTHDISVVAHSMGGLIASYYLRYGTQEIESAIETWKGADSLTSVVMAGVPFLGVMHSFRNMNFGVTVGLNASLLSAEAYSSFPASYYTLPLADSDELLSPELQPVTSMIRNPTHWRQFEWGLLSNTMTPVSNEVVERRTAYTARWLHRSQRFLELVGAPPTTTHPDLPPLLYVYAKGTPTLSKAVWKGNQAKGPDSLVFDDPEASQSDRGMPPPTIYSDGDGTVTVSSALLPPAFRQTMATTIREYAVGHTELVKEATIQQDIVTFLGNHE